MDKNTDLAEIQNLPIPELTEMLGALTPAELVDLRALEVAEANRKGALEAIDSAIAATVPPAADARPDEKEVPPPAAAEDPAAAPAWQEPQYTGPLDIEQAQWRLHNIKPVGKVRTK